jgi:hypothetical protein
VVQVQELADTGLVQPPPIFVIEVLRQDHEYAQRGRVGDARGEFAGGVDKHGDEASGDAIAAGWVAFLNDGQTVSVRRLHRHYPMRPHCASCANHCAYLHNDAC